MFRAEVVLDHCSQLGALRGSFRDCHQSVALLLESPPYRLRVKIAFALEVTIETALCKTEFLHDLADAVQLGPVLSERPRSGREDLLAGSGLLLDGIPHAHKITIVIEKMQGRSASRCTSQ